jgi:hypothetical protein
MRNLEQRAGFNRRPDVLRPNGNKVIIDRRLCCFETIEHVLHPADHSIFVAVVYIQMNRLRTRLWQQAKLKGR